VVYISEIFELHGHTNMTEWSGHASV